MQVEPDFLELLKILVRHEVDFIVCGGIAAILHGAPLMTADLDAVYEPSEDNCRRLLAAIAELQATYFDVAGRHIVPDLDTLGTLRLHLLNTCHGRLDLLREIAGGADYNNLIDRSRKITIDDLQIFVLDLEAIIESKEAADRPKDKAALPFLRALVNLKDEDGPT